MLQAVFGLCKQHAVTAAAGVCRGSVLLFVFVQRGFRFADKVAVRQIDFLFAKSVFCCFFLFCYY